MIFAVGFPLPWPALVSMRINTGAGPACADCISAANLNECAGHDAVVVVRGRQQQRWIVGAGFDVV